MFFALRLFGYLSFAFLCSFGLLRFCYKYTHGFNLQKIISRLEPSFLFQNPELGEEQQEELKKLFSQPFYYLGKGAQSYVFVSEDGETVLKFCRFDHLRPSYWYNLFRFPFSCLYERERVAKILHKRGRLEHEFESHKIAFFHLKKETGLLYIHLNKGSLWAQTLTLFDNLKVRHLLNIDNMEFLVQKRASLFYPTLQKWLEEGKEDFAKEGLVSFLELIKRRHCKGIFDKDPDIETNFGFLGSCAIQIDTGRFSIAPLPSLESELRRITYPLSEWLKVRSPQLALYLEEELSRLCKENL